uniref:Uncharacterized protein n=1 Tax=Arundo donax TaxID=35708 RepID=A0A0A9FJH6_ARUDO
MLPGGGRTGERTQATRAPDRLRRGVHLC